MKIAPFARSSPFHGLVVPEDVRVFRQVLAQPSIDLASRTWAQLRDGTPLVTARKIGDGWLVLFHASANAEWSSLPLSGLFVDMLRRVVDMARGVAGNESGDLPPLFSLDAQGGLRAPLPTALALPLDRLSEIEPGPRHPAGLYGRGDARRAFNLGARLAPPKNLTVLPKEAVVTGYDRHREVDLMPWILLAAFIAALLDLIAIVALKGLLPVVGGGAARAGGIALAVITATSIAVVAWPGASWSQERPMAKQPVNDDAWSIMASEKTRLAYILSGDKEVDAMSAAGLRGLSMVLTDRTAVEPAAPIGLDVERDDFVLFPFIYWPISARAPILSGPAVVRVKSYLRGGGMIMFDSRDAEFEAVGGDAGENRLWLKALLRRLDLPALVPVPANHVLTKSYYLLQSFPGRHAGGRVWVEKAGRHSKDGVSSVIIGSNDWASAWALGPSGRPLAALVSRHPRQREFAFRFGVNAVMYTLTGNYKADQVHVPAILERLGN